MEYYPYREFVEAGLAEPVYHGPSGYRAYIEATYDVWGTGVRLEPTELIDLGDRVVLLPERWSSSVCRPRTAGGSA
jgi:hypothetical protein